MTKAEIKTEVLATLRKVEPVEKLPVFVQRLKEETFFRLVCGMITKETAETIKEQWGE